MGYASPNVGSVLTAPTRETADLDLPDDVSAVDECIKAINDFAGKVADLWGGPDPLDIPTFNELIQEHFSGDFQSIAANGEACVNTGNGLSEISGSIVDATAELQLHWQGAASLEFTARMSLFAAATEAAGFIVQQGKALFDIASTASRELGETVGSVIGLLIDLAEKLVKKIAEKLNWLTGLVSWVRDAFTGFDDIRDVVDMVTELWDGINWLLDAKDNAYEFFELIKSSFEIFGELKDLMTSIPDLRDGGLQGAADFAKKAQGIREDIAELKEGLSEQLSDDAEEGESEADGLTADAPSGD